MNKILVAIDKAKAAIDAQSFSPEKLTQLSKSMDMELDEYCHFQTLKTLAVGNRLTLEEAQTIYGFLGNTVEHFNRQPLPVKVVLTHVFAELMRR